MFLTTPRLEVIPDPDHPGRYLRWFRSVDPWEYVYSGDDGRTRRWRFEPGYVTDLSSVPTVLHWWLDPFELGVAAFPHDEGYRHAGKVPVSSYDVDGEPGEPWTRKGLDQFYRRVLRELGTSSRKRRAAYWGLRLGARAIWQKYEQGYRPAILGAWSRFDWPMGGVETVILSPPPHCR